MFIVSICVNLGVSCTVVYFVYILLCVYMQRNVCNSTCLMKMRIN